MSKREMATTVMISAVLLLAAVAFAWSDVATWASEYRREGNNMAQMRRKIVISAGDGRPWFIHCERNVAAKIAGHPAVEYIDVDAGRLPYTVWIDPRYDAAEVRADLMALAEEEDADLAPFRTALGEVER